MAAASVAQIVELDGGASYVYSAGGAPGRLALEPAAKFVHARHVSADEETFDFAIVARDGVGGVWGGSEGDVVQFFGDVGGCVCGGEGQGECEEGE